MSKKTAGLVGAISALPLVGVGPAAHAHTLDEVMTPRSYAELLQPIPNAAALLGEAKAREEPRPEPRIQTAQYYGAPYYGNPYYGGYGYFPYPRPRYYPHHHHWNGGRGGWGGGGYYRPRYYHHHHHRHWNGGGWW